MKLKALKILVVEDEEDICEILKFNLENEGYSVDVANSAEEALKLKLERYNLILLDIMMGKMSGFRFAEIIRKERKIQNPIVFLTAKDTENDTLTGFSLGADDYISKPFSVREVIARIKAVLNRSNSTVRKDETIVVKKMTIDISSKKVTINNVKINLTKKEFDILLLLVENLNKVFSRELIMNSIWEDDVIINNRSIDVHMARLRKKMGEYGAAIINRSGYGYCFDTDKLQ